VLEVSLAAFIIHAPPGVFLVAQPQPEALAVQGLERDVSEKTRVIRERRIWKAIIDAECQRLEVFLRTCTFD
jgi:hypothetical protein